jgi:hypothetical protein
VVELVVACVTKNEPGQLNNLLVETTIEAMPNLPGTMVFDIFNLLARRRTP